MSIIHNGGGRRMVASKQQSAARRFGPAPLGRAGQISHAGESWAIGKSNPASAVITFGLANNRPACFAAAVATELVQADGLTQHHCFHDRSPLYRGAHRRNAQVTSSSRQVPLPRGNESQSRRAGQANFGANPQAQ